MSLISYKSHIDEEWIRSALAKEMEVAAAQWGVPPRRISFALSLRALRNLFAGAATVSPGSLRKLRKNLRGATPFYSAAEMLGTALRQARQDQDERPRSQ